MILRDDPDVPTGVVDEVTVLYEPDILEVFAVVRALFGDCDLPL